ncbi:MAG: GIY-YIG nuclease family protein [Chloroflexota bacterium]|nr:GIY-YIG nuclease family protein [Chloroflexota bacterium]
MSFYVYILRCSDGSFYTGHTDNLEARISSHYTRLIAGYTSRRRPVTLEFTEEFPTRIEALERERQITGAAD